MAIPDHFPHAALDAFVIMPNHIHGIILIVDNVGADPVSVRAKDLSPLQTPFRSSSRTIDSIVRGFKIGVTKWMRTNTDVYAVWQRNYYEHVIRNETALNRTRRYIVDNPADWAEDMENPGHPVVVG